MIPFYLLDNNELITIDYLVIGGGGIGGEIDYGNLPETAADGGGGGAGGYICSVPGEPSGANSGAASRVFYRRGDSIVLTVGGANSHSVLGPITALAGGAGGVAGFIDPIYPNLFRNGGSGGSGGGGGGGGPTFINGGAGTSNQGLSGANGNGEGRSTYRTNMRAGGGGGAGSAGSNQNGGNGLTSSITGTAVTRAGGGGGCVGTSQTTGTGGTGGGGAGGKVLSFGGGGGAINTGSGGGGGTYYMDAGFGPEFHGAGNGGSGIVVLRYPATARIIDRISPGLVYTYSDDGIWKRYIFTGGTGTIKF